MFTEVMSILEALEEDVMYSTDSEGNVYATIKDFVGFDDEYVERDLDDADAVDAMVTWLEDHCLSQDGYFYRYYHFDGFTVCVDYASFEI